MGSGGVRAFGHSFDGGRRAAERLGARLVDAVFPPRCMACAAPVDAHGALCAECWPALQFIAGPVCRCCGVPLPDEDSAEGRFACVPCTNVPPVVPRAVII